MEKHIELWAILQPVTEGDMDKYLKLLMPCIEDKILRPRYELFALLIILFDSMRLDKDVRKKLENDILDWLMRWDIKFGKIIEDIPNEVNRIVKETLGKTVHALLGEYINDFPENFEEVKSDKVNNMVKEWMSPKLVETIIEDEPTRKDIDTELWKKVEWRKRSYKSDKDFRQNVSETMK